MSTSTHYLEMILSAIQWGLNERSPAWKRTIDYVNRNQDLYDISGVNEAQSELKREATRSIGSWFVERFSDEGSTGFDKIESMSPEELWTEIVLDSNRPFGGVKDPLVDFLVAVPAKIRHTAPIWLKPNVDGWGIAATEQSQGP